MIQHFGNIVIVYLYIIFGWLSRALTENFSGGWRGNEKRL